MRLLAARTGSLIALLAALVLSARCIWSQRLGAEEFSRHANTAIAELLGRSHSDPDTVKRLRNSLLPPGSDALNQRQAKNRLFDAIRRRDLGLERKGSGFVALPKESAHLSDQIALKTSGEFVDSVWSVIRRLNILDEIGPHTSTELDHDQLREFLKNRGTVADYRQVTESFDPSLKTEVVTFQRTTTLLRLYGGAANANGRYYFCCLLKLTEFPDGKGGTFGLRTTASLPWADASGLATPPDNLLQDLKVATIPAGTTAIVGTVADNFLGKLKNAARGGNTQIFIPEVNTFAYEHYRLVSSVPSPITEIALQSDDRILRFRRGSHK